MSRRLKTLYQYFYQYSKEEIHSVIKKLNVEEQELIRKRYGDDLNNPIPGNLSNSEHYRFYDILIPKIGKLLYNPQVLEKEKITLEDIVINDDINIKINIIGKILYMENNNYKYYDFISQEDYSKFIDFIKSDTFISLLKQYSTKELTILILKLGYINNKCFSNYAIAQFLNIDIHEVTEIIKNILLCYKESINKSFDNLLNAEENLHNKKN